VWFNGHFTRDPEILGRLDPATGAVDSFVVPRHPALGDSGGPVPYELRLAPDGAVWMSELQGNRLIRLDREGSMRLYEMPEPWSGPRRLDVDRGGRVWIPAYSGGAVWRLEPGSGRFKRYPLPIADAAPYVCRVNPATGDVWVGAGAADVVFRIDPASGKCRVYPLVTRGATIRHMAVDAGRNEVWLALGASPAIHPARIVRLRPRD
jgi:virginiamycin B lyase